MVTELKGLGSVGKGGDGGLRYFAESMASSFSTCEGCVESVLAAFVYVGFAVEDESGEMLIMDGSL